MLSRNQPTAFYIHLFVMIQNGNINIQIRAHDDGVKQGIDQQTLIWNRFHVKLRILSP